MRRYPLLIAGLGIRRWEYIGGKEADFPWLEGKLLFNLKPGDNGPGPSHLQKFTKWGPGFLITRPLCFHFWWIFRQQQKKENGEHIPGSEIVLYWRFGKWRWDANMGKYIGPGTWFFGLHWD